MRIRLRLALLAGLSGLLLLLLGYAARSATENLMEVPPQSWGMSHLSDAVVAGTCGIGAVGALWHAVSAALALAALPGPQRSTPRRRGETEGLAVRVLESWGAPAVRRIAASALLVSLSSAPALAAEGATSSDDLGWRPTSSAPVSPSPTQTPAPSSQPGQSPSGSADEDRPTPTAEPDGAQSAVGTSSSATSPSQASGPASTPDGSEHPGASNSTPPTSAPEAPSGRTHTVLPGESLWSITAALLPPGSTGTRIAQSWPALYRANAAVIGRNPSLIRPGTVLTIPSSLAASTSTTGGQPSSR